VKDIIKDYSITLDGASLDTGSYDLITLPAGTSFVITAVRVNKKDGFITDLRGEVTGTGNGIHVGDFTVNSDGPEAIPDGGKLTLKHTGQYPLVLTQLDYLAMDSAARAYNGKVVTTNGIVAEITYAQDLTTAAPANNSTGFRPIFYQVGVSYYMLFHDGNSVAGFYYWADKDATPEYFTGSSYSVYAMDNDSDGVYFIPSGTIMAGVLAENINKLHKHTPAGGVECVGTAGYGVALSTYCRAYVFKGYFFYLVASNFSSEVLIHRCSDGAYLGSCSGAAISHDAQTKLFAGYRPSTDKIHVYRIGTSSTVCTEMEINLTKTAMDAVSVGNTGDATTSVYNANHAINQWIGTLLEGQGFANSFPFCHIIGGDTELTYNRAFYNTRVDPYWKVVEAGIHTNSNISVIDPVITTAFGGLSYIYNFGIPRTPDANDLTTFTFNEDYTLDLMVIGIESTQ
jgi:hypothetical protein